MATFRIAVGVKMDTFVYSGKPWPGVKKSP
jgi:hypothetical protein